MENKSIISRMITGATLTLFPIMRISANAPKVTPAAIASIKLGAAIMLSKFLATIILSFFVLKKINKAWWTPSIVAVTLVSDMICGLIAIALFKYFASVPHIIMVSATILPSFLIQVAIWYAVLGRKYPKTALKLTGISALYPITMIILQVFYWVAGIGY